MRIMEIRKVANLYYKDKHGRFNIRQFFFDNGSKTEEVYMLVDTFEGSRWELLPIKPLVRKYLGVQV